MTEFWMGRAKEYLERVQSAGEKQEAPEDQRSVSAFHQLRGILAGTTSCDSVEYVRSIRDEDAK